VFKLYTQFIICSW